MTAATACSLQCKVPLRRSVFISRSAVLASGRFEFAPFFSHSLAHVFNYLSASDVPIGAERHTRMLVCTNRDE